MTIQASYVLGSASLTLQDPTMIRWVESELLGYFNDGVRRLITVRPDTCVKKTPVTPVVGARQTLPDDAVALIDIIGNTSGKQTGITKVDMDVLTASNRDWQSATKAAVVLHFMYDQRDPYFYYVYPPANGLGSIDILHSYYPSLVTTLAGSVPVHAQWTTALINYVLSRAYNKDAEYGGNAQAAAAYMTAFTNEIGEQLQSSTAVSPKS